MLLVDVGNSRIKWRSLLPDGSLGPKRVFAHDGANPAGWVDSLWPDLPRPDKVIVANVAGKKIGDALERWTQTHWRLEPRFATSKIHELGIHNGYDNPDYLGVDRWVAMLGARQRSEHHCVVIDCGTAATLDALTAGGDHLGGVILPGVRLMHAALRRNTALDIQQLPDEVVMLGTNTNDCIWGGTVHAIAAAIDRVSSHMAAQMRRRQAGPVERLLTGGNGPALQRYLQGDYRSEPELIFLGLKQIALHRFH